MPPPRDVQDIFKYVSNPIVTPAVGAGANPSWVGAWKDPRLVVDFAGNLITPGSGTTGWVNIDGTPWHVTDDATTAKYWAAGNPDVTGPYTHVVLFADGTMADEGPGNKSYGAWYKCCTDLSPTDTVINVSDVTSVVNTFSGSGSAQFVVTVTNPTGGVTVTESEVANPSIASP